MVWHIENGGTEDSYITEPFGANGVISEEEAAAVRLLKEMTANLYRAMNASEDQYMLSSAEVYQRLTEMLQKVQRQMAQS